jgi:uridylate kinase
MPSSVKDKHQIHKKKPRRILLKLSGEALMGKQPYGIDVEFLNELAKKIVYLSKYKGIQLVIVI